MIIGNWIILNLRFSNQWELESFISNLAYRFSFIDHHLSIDIIPLSRLLVIMTSLASLYEPRGLHFTHDVVLLNGWCNHLLRRSNISGFGFHIIIIKLWISLYMCRVSKTDERVSLHNCDLHKTTTFEDLNVLIKIQYKH